ncbi:MAG: hypothetical protein ACOC0Q_09355, partial [Wenzhouxiangella sp.]
TGILAVLGLAGCAVPGERNPDAAAENSGAALGMMANRVQGVYGAAQRLDQDKPDIQMVVSAARPDQATLMLELRERRAERQRGMLLQLRAGDGALPLFEGYFSPLLADGTVSPRACPMRFRLRNGLLSGQTEADQCRFGQGSDAIGLVKEVALDGRNLIIADQLAPAGGRPAQPPDILRLHRLETFRGQVRVRDDSGWRTAEQIELTVGGAPIEPLDAAGMTLGIRVRLALIESRSAESPLLYLQAGDAEGTRVLGQAWSDIASERLGLALDGIQITLEKRPEMTPDARR